MKDYGKIMRVDKDFDKIVKEMQTNMANDLGLSDKKRLIGTVIVTRKIAEDIKKKRSLRL